MYYSLEVILFESQLGNKYGFFLSVGIQILIHHVVE